MTHSKRALLTFAFASLVSAAHAGDEFEAASNPSGWSFGITVADTLEPTGGNPGGWLHNDSVDSFAPILTSDGNIASDFNGDYRAMGVTGISIDARTDDANFGAGGREFSLLLRDTKGTASVNDDDYAYFVGSLVPQPGQGWVHYDFDIPSASTAAVPTGWSGGWVGDGENFRPGIDWNDVIQNVDVVEFWWLNPAFFAIFQTWDVGVDNICINSSVGTVVCDPANINASGFPAVLSGSFSGAGGSGLHLECVQGPPMKFGYFLVGTDVTDPGVPISSGRLCLSTVGGNSIGRYNITGGLVNSIGQFDVNGVLQNLVSTSSVGSGFDVPTMVPSIGGAITSGNTWHFQVWFREGGAVAGVSNFSNSLSVTF